MKQAAVYLAYQEALDACSPARLLKAHIKLTGDQLYLAGKTFKPGAGKPLKVVAAGKAAALMAAETAAIAGEWMSEGLVIAKHGHGVPLRHFHYKEAGHPIPDQHSIAAAEALVEFATRTRRDDLLLLLISGGTSALITDIPPGCTLEEIQKVNVLLTQSGCTINETNIVRKHLSTIKGGQLLRYINATTVVALLVSDVPGDDPGVIGSGLVAADSSTYKDAIAIIRRYGLSDHMPAAIMNYLAEGVRKRHPETIRPRDPLLKKVTQKIIAGNALAIAAAKTRLLQEGYFVTDQAADLNGDTLSKAKEISRVLINSSERLPAAFVWGGESTLRVTGKGKGGRNQHMALALLYELKKLNTVNRKISILCAGTDGTDGPTDAAGALVTDDLIKNPALRPETIKEYLDNFDS